MMLRCLIADAAAYAARCHILLRCHAAAIDAMPRHAAAATLTPPC